MSALSRNACIFKVLCVLTLKIFQRYWKFSRCYLSFLGVTCGRSSLILITVQYVSSGSCFIEGCIIKQLIYFKSFFLQWCHSHFSSSEQPGAPFHSQLLRTNCLPLINERISDWYTLLKSNNNFCWHPSCGREHHESQDIGCLYLMNASFTRLGVI